MRILILTTHLNPGGISRYVLNLAKGLKEQGDDVWVASCGGEWLLKLKEEKISHKYIPIKTKSILSPKVIFSLLFLLPFIHKEKIQIIHANTRVTQFLGYLIYRLSSIPYISSFHGFHQPGFFRRIFKLSGIKTIAVSQSVAEHLKQDFAISEEKINVVHNGIDPAFCSGRIRQKEDFGFKKDDFILGVLGRISEEKGQFLAVEAFESLAQKNQNFYLILSAAGRLKHTFASFLDRRGLKNKVKLVDLEASDFLDIVDLLLVPSRKEGFGYSILEAFAKGIAVVGFNTGGIAEIIKNKENGLLFYKYEGSSLKEAIEQVLNDAELWAKIIKGAKASLCLFSLEEMAKNTRRVYEETLRQ